ncbi:hypothetical protein OZ410_12500 [Robiginitalea sp. M366]|uniref:hypothetical protein n=1 Tax=Robiginitalea aestuariiviva TaxID=3036903 RepID=UPI00240E962A|nr:hypothetical protein [Robiginitalea aestuariiviva]MDG1573142.1 hypothetical protein [Robiginitalea aestuariiviva]
MALSFSDFMDSLRAESPDPSLSPALKALWFDGKGDWEASHNIAQDMPGVAGSRIHAYLHRKEGDRWNAGYWYDRAGYPFPDCSLEAEFRTLVKAFLESGA